MMSDQVIDLTLSSSDSDVDSAGESDTGGSPLKRQTQVAWPGSRIVDESKRYIKSYLNTHYAAGRDEFWYMYVRLRGDHGIATRSTPPLTVFCPFSLSFFHHCSALSTETILSDEESTPSV